MKNERIDKYCKFIYLGFVVFFISLVIYIVFNFKTNMYSHVDESKTIVIDNWELYTEDGTYLGLYGNTPLNVAPDEFIVMRTRLPYILPYDYCMGFSSSHLNLFVYAGNELIYEFSTGDNCFGHTPGYGYHMIPQIYKYSDKEIEIYISSPYGITVLPEIELSSAKTLFFRQLALSTLPFGISIITLMIGIFILCYGIYTIIKANVNKSFLFLGLFTITLAIYTANEQTVFLLMTGNHVVSAYLSFITLMIMPIPFILFLKELYTNNNHIAWYIVIGLNFLNLTATTLLQVLNIADYRETLTATHIMYIITITTTVVMTIYELIKYKLTTSMKLNLICISVVAVFLIAALVVYYKSDQQEPTVLGNLGFLIYIIVVGIHSIKSNTSLLAKGRQAEKYRSLAYTDNLTGLKNRTSHDAHLTHSDTSIHRYIIAMFDLNELKYYNDNLGHEVGDKYIVTSANIIKAAFGSLADDHCYRIGGDEFCAIFEDKTVEDFNSAYETFCKLIDEFNSTSSDLQIHIATGYAEYDSSIDSDLKETRSRADAMMYKNKFMIKQKMGTLR